MARPIKTGLNYFPLDVDIFDDPKLLHIENQFGVKGELITVKLLCWIYRDGYSCEWNNDTALIFAKKNFSNIGASLCNEVVTELIKREFFNRRLFDSFGVLTSEAIQSRWLKVVTSSKRKCELNPFLNLLVQEETPPKREESTQSKVKKSKVDKSKVNIPAYDDFKSYALEKLPDVDLERLRLKYDSWEVNDWKTGKGAEIKNWKSTLLHTLPYLKKEKNVAPKKDKRSADQILMERHGITNPR